MATELVVCVQLFIQLDPFIKVPKETANLPFIEKYQQTKEVS